MKTCRDCGERKPPLDFHRKKANPDGLAHSCKVCHHARLGRKYTGDSTPAADHPFRRSIRNEVDSR